jgi:hypothetical protein
MSILRTISTDNKNIQLTHANGRTLQTVSTQVRSKDFTIDPEGFD